jgi:hypothetical protein
MSDSLDKADKEMKASFWNSILGAVLGIIVWAALILIIYRSFSPKMDIVVASCFSLIGGLVLFFIGHTSSAKKESHKRLVESVGKKAERTEMLQIYKDLRESIDKKADSKDFEFVKASLENVNRILEFNQASHQEIENKITEIYQFLVVDKSNSKTKKITIKKGK